MLLYSCASFLACRGSFYRSFSVRLFLTVPFRPLSPSLSLPHSRIGVLLFRHAYFFSVLHFLACLLISVSNLLACLFFRFFLACLFFDPPFRSTRASFFTRASFYHGFCYFYACIFLAGLLYLSARRAPLLWRAARHFSVPFQCLFLSVPVFRLV